MGLLLTLLAILLVVFGVVRLIQRDFLWGVILIVVGVVLGSVSPGVWF